MVRLTKQLCQAKGWEHKDWDITDCDVYKKEWTRSRQKTLKFAAKQLISYFPCSKQVVLGTLKYLVPYMVFPRKFTILAMDEKVWTEDVNNLMIFCIVKGYFTKGHRQPIRLVTTPEELHTKGNLRITGKEVCILKHQYNLKFWKCTKETNLFFVSEESLKGREFRKVNTKGDQCYIIKGGHKEIVQFNF